jgi:4-diphosphocytidyl-2-C-methyl-D-erythritol kinase
VTARPSSDFTISVTGDVDVSGVPLDGSNLAMRAARLVARRVEWTGVHLDIRKGVPVAGGMGAVRRMPRPRSSPSTSCSTAV